MNALYFSFIFFALFFSLAASDYSEDCVYNIYVKTGSVIKGGIDSKISLVLEEDLAKDFKKEKQVLFEWVIFILIIVALICSSRLPYLRRKTLWKIVLWKWEVLALVVICGRLLSVWIFKIIILSFERNLLFRQRVSFFVYDLRKKVQHCFWLGLVLIAWLYLFDEKIAKETYSNKAISIVTRLLASLVVATTLWLVKAASVNVFASNFYTSTYFKRILDSIFSQYVIEVLSGPPLFEIQETEEEERNADEVRNVHNVGATTIPTALGGASPYLSAKQPFMKGHKKHQEITIDLLHRLTPENVSAWNMTRLMNIVQQGALSTLEQIQDSNYRDESIEIRSEFEAEIVAEKIFRNVAKPGSRYIFLEDITRFMRGVEASRTLSLLNGGFKSKKISLSALKNWVVSAFEERRVLGLTLDDVGDRCKIDGEQMVIEEINLLDTIFLRDDKQKTTISNSVLTSKMITNYNRGPDMEDEILFFIHLAIPTAKIAMMKERIKSGVSSKEKHWHPKPTIICMDIEDLNRVTFKVLLKHRMNHQDMKRDWIEKDAWWKR